ncbi:MAG: type II toxin-antitoxin system Phd/YefM family antitoxin [Ignavibacteriae bacterium]|nr:type II toxin-antitoxin system Phd/YefM family antitoxin [Ignavibacteriota bacterium]
MKSISVAKLKNNFYDILDDLSLHDKPVKIIGKKNNAILISEDHWNSLQETMYLLSIPGMKESILEAKNEPLENWSTKLPW